MYYKTPEVKNEMEIVIVLPKSEYQEENIQTLLTWARLPLDAPSHYRPLIFHTVRGGFERAVAYTHAEITKFTERVNTNEDVVTFTLLIKQKRDKFVGVLFGRAPEETYQKALANLNAWVPVHGDVVQRVAGVAYADSGFNIVVYYSTPYDKKDASVNKKISATKESGKFYAKNYKELLDALGISDDYGVTRGIRTIDYTRHGIKWQFTNSSSTHNVQWDAQTLIEKVGKVTGFYVSNSSANQIHIKRQTAQLTVKLYESDKYSKVIESKDFVAYNINNTNYIANVHDVCKFLNIQYSNTAAKTSITLKAINSNKKDVTVTRDSSSNIDKFTVRNFVNLVSARNLSLEWKKGDSPLKPVIRGITVEGGQVADALSNNDGKRADAYMEDIVKFTGCTRSLGSSGTTATIKCNGVSKEFSASNGNAFVENGNIIVYTNDFYLFASSNMKKWDAKDNNLFNAYLGKGYRESTISLYDKNESDNSYFLYRLTSLRFNNDEAGGHAARDFNDNQNNVGNNTTNALSFGISIGGAIISSPWITAASLIIGGYALFNVDYSYKVQKGDTITSAQILTSKMNESINSITLQHFLFIRDINGNLKTNYTLTEYL